MPQLNARGFARSATIVALVVVLGIGGAGYYLLRKSSAATFNGIKLNVKQADIRPTSIVVSWNTPVLPETGRFAITYKRVGDDSWVSAQEQQFTTLTGAYRIAELSPATKYMMRTAHDAVDLNGKHRRVYGPTLAVQTPSDDLAALKCRVSVPKETKANEILTIKYTITNTGPALFIGEGFTLSSQAYVSDSADHIQKSWSLPGLIASKKSQTYSHSFTVPISSSTTSINYFGELVKAGTGYASPNWACSAGSHQIRVVR